MCSRGYGSSFRGPIVRHALDSHDFGRTAHLKIPLAERTGMLGRPVFLSERLTRPRWLHNEIGRSRAQLKNSSSSKRLQRHVATR